jgi:signal transduction histidine kinase
MRPYNEDSLRAILAVEPVDTARVELFVKLQESYFFKQPDSSLHYAKKALELSREIGYTIGILQGLRGVGEAHRQLSNFKDALKTQFELLNFSEENGAIDYEVAANGFIGINYFELHQFEQAISRLSNAVIRSKPIHHESTQGREAVFNIFLARAYNEINQTDTAFYYLNEAKRIYTIPKSINLIVLREFCIGDVYRGINNNDLAKFHYKRALEYTRKNPKDVPNHISTTSYKLALMYDLENQLDSSLYFARNAYRIGKGPLMKLRMLEASSLLSKLHRQTGRLDSVVYFQDIAIALNDSIYGKDEFRELQVLLLEEQRRSQERLRAEEIRIREVQQGQERFQNNVLIVGLLIVTTIILVTSILLFRNNRIKQKTNLVLQQTLTELKATQSQLIQSEKMASLGELTAGIAHEIQNPLNFVNNFSEVNTELIGELEQEVDNGNLIEIKSLTKDIKENEQKINHHGKRAGDIVKGMLEHSRSSSGVKEPTDINALANEYLRLAYHGLRAKDKTFSAKFEMDFDASIGKVNVVPQDIGRVVLNLINNAFYAVSEKKKSFEDVPAGQEVYEPTVIVSTKKSDDKLLISVKDNGNGIPQKVLDKIFQPFFTTKPTGQGTGLGLSLSYDIVKSHGGEINVNTKENEGTEFTITLPA